MEELIAGTMDFIARHGAWDGPIMGLLTFTESVAVAGILVPGTAALLGIGGLVGAGVIDAFPVLLWAIAGAFLGAWLSYAIGRRIGYKAYPSWSLNRNREAVARTRLFFRKYATSREQRGAGFQKVDEHGGHGSVSADAADPRCHKANSRGSRHIPEVGAPQRHW